MNKKGPLGLEKEIDTTTISTLGYTQICKVLRS